jgi:hypothetical protein
MSEGKKNLNEVAANILSSSELLKLAEEQAAKKSKENKKLKNANRK